MAARIDDDFMTAEFDGRVIATARSSSHAAADGQSGWIVSGWPGRLFSRNKAITAMVLAERRMRGARLALLRKHSSFVGPGEQIRARADRQAHPGADEIVHDRLYHSAIECTGPDTPD